MKFSIQKVQALGIDQTLAIIFMLLCVPAFLINLGLVPYIEDESIRILVGYEMYLTGDWLSPRLNGDLYYKKPPLYNWIIAFSSLIFGDWNEWTSRIPTVLFLFLFGYSIYAFYSKESDRKMAVIMAVLFMTSGRVLFWDSFLGLIDICFSWIAFLMMTRFYGLFWADKRSNWIYIYILLAVGFLLKTLPIIIFFGCTVLACLIWSKRWKYLFCKQQFIGLFIAIVLLSAYYIPYLRVNDLETLLNTLWSENASRTVLENAWIDSLKQLFLFPLEMGYHFLLWSLLALYLLQKSFWKSIRETPILLFSVLVFASNIWVYWSSPKIFPRYLFPLLPFFIHIVYQSYRSSRHQTLFRYAYAAIMIGSIGIPIAGYFHPEMISAAGNVWKSSLLLIAFSICIWAYFRYPSRTILLIGMHLLVIRIAFNWFVLPHREQSMWPSLCKSDAIRIGNEYVDEPLSIYGWTSFRYESSFHISTNRKVVLKRTMNLHSGELYIIDKKFPPPKMEAGEIIDSLRTSIQKEWRYIWKAP